MRILVTGTHGVGKTTLVNALLQKLPKYERAGSITRKLSEFGLD